ncbi:hypothetical protein HNQ99_001065 [Rhizorhapis suberifaciens]|uniref:Uncharacterized protein n=1 Tax=Rhizorhapis suberifaciens TaxID=13656 RepID=A0A840HRL0_9SPHN|nr:hypothetical protein [Rhizorhapis suberifaciens]
MALSLSIRLIALVACGGHRLPLAKNIIPKKLLRSLRQFHGERSPESPEQAKRPATDSVRAVLQCNRSR